MTLKEMCEQVAVFTDRRDDFVTIVKDGAEVYDPDDDPGNWFASMRTSINTAYRHVARQLLMPDVRQLVVLGDGGSIDLLTMEPGVTTVKAVYNEDGSAALTYDFETKYRIIVRGDHAGEKVLLQYHYVPADLTEFTDEPVFPESLVDPMIYISLAAADLWLMERKLDVSREWRTKYYELMSSVKRDMRSSRDRRIKRAIFR